MPKPLYQARYRGKPEWDWEYTTRGYTVTDLEKAKEPTYKWLEEAKKRDKPLQVQVVIVDPERRWGEVVWGDFYKKDEFYGKSEAERCKIAQDITKDILQEQCKTEDNKCKIAKEISEDIVSRECDREDIDDAFYNFLQKDFGEAGYYVEYVNEDNNYMYFKLIDKKTNKKSRIIELTKDRLCKEVSAGRSKYLAREVIGEL